MYEAKFLSGRRILMRAKHIKNAPKYSFLSRIVREARTGNYRLNGIRTYATIDDT